MSITATELKANLGKYLLLATAQDIYITQNGEAVAKLVSPYQDRLNIAEFLFGSMPASMMLEEAPRRNARPCLKNKSCTKTG